MTPGLAICSSSRCLQQLGERLVAGLHARVLAQPHQRRRPPLGGHLVVEQPAQALEDLRAGVDERHLVLQLVVLAGGICRSKALCRISRSSRTRLSVSVRAVRHSISPAAASSSWRSASSSASVGFEMRSSNFARPCSRALLGRVLELHVEQLVGVGVAALDPGALGMGGARVPGGLRRVRHEAHQERTGQMAHPRLPTDTPQYRGATL